MKIWQEWAIALGYRTNLEQLSKTAHLEQISTEITLYLVSFWKTSERLSKHPDFVGVVPICLVVFRFPTHTL